MSFISGVWRLLGAEVDEGADENIVEYPSNHPAARTRTPEPEPSPTGNIIALQEPQPLVISVVRPELDAGGKEQYSMKRYCDMLRQSQPLLVDLNKLYSVNEEHAMRVIDILNGIILANEGRVYKITHNIYIFAPKNVKMSGDPIEQVEIA